MSVVAGVEVPEAESDVEGKRCLGVAAVGSGEKGKSGTFL